MTIRNKERRNTLLVDESADFATRKQQALVWLRAPVQLDSRGEEEPIDENIRGLIVEMNERLPFLYTWGSCEGHFDSRKDILARYPGVPEDRLQLPSEGYVSCFGGEVCFDIDGGEASERFLRSVERLLAAYPDAGLRRLSMDHHAYILRFSRANVTVDPDACTEVEAVAAKAQIVVLMQKLTDLAKSF